MKKAVLVSIMALGLSGVAAAGVVPYGSFGFSLTGCCNLDGQPQGTGDLNTTNIISWLDNGAGGTDFIILSDPTTTFGNPNIFLSLASSTGEIDPDQVSTTGGDTLTMTFGPTYSFTSSSESIGLDPTEHAVNYYFLGTFTDSSGTYNSQAASLTLSFSQSGANTAVSGEGTFSTPPAPNVPEPATVALIGAALIGLAAMRRKKA